MKIKKCYICGGKSFLIRETIIHKAETSEEDGDLTVYALNSHVIEVIFCEECEKEYSEDDFNVISF